VSAALDFGARRIGHGVRAVEDPAVLDRLAQTQTPVEICPTSEMQTAAIASLAALPLRELLDADVCVTINSDNMGVSDTDVGKEFALLRREHGIGQEEALRLQLNAVSAAFADEATKERLRDAIMQDATA
jgi:adenosine deaminase